jgi:hypothetical protein
MASGDAKTDPTPGAVSGAGRQNKSFKINKLTRSLLIGLLAHQIVQ